MFFLTPNIRPISHTKSLNAQFRGLKSFFFFLFFLHTLKQFQQQQWTYCETLANPTDDNPLITTPDSIFISPHLPQTNEDEEETKIISSFDKPETNTGLLKELKPHAKLLRPFKNKTNEDLFSKKIEDKRVNLSKVKEQTSLINRSPINKEKQDHSKEEEPTTFITSLSINKEREDVLKKEEQTNIITPLSINNEGTDLSNKEEQTDIITPSSINKEGANPSNNEEQTDIITPLSINKEGADLSNKEEQTNLTTLLPVNKEGTDFASKKEETNLITSLPVNKEGTDFANKKEETNLITSLPVNKEGTDLANKGEQTSLITPLPINQEKRNSLVPFVTPKTTFKEYLYTNMFSTFILLTWITFIYILQLYIDRNFNLSFYRSNHACSCLLAGGNLRGLGETSLVTFARMIACCFIHISFPHYLTTLITLVGSCCFAFTLFPIYNWIPYWVVPLYLICGLAKSIMTWKKKLYSVGTSSSASGSCFGIAAFIWILHPLTDSSKPSTLCNFIFWGCILCSGNKKLSIIL
jgi:membrane associated rhomboid family serine protease